MEKRELESILRKENSRKNRIERDEKAKAARTPDNLRFVVVGGGGVVVCSYCCFCCSCLHFNFFNFYFFEFF